MTSAGLGFDHAEHQARLAAVRTRMAAQDLELCLISTPENVFYLTGLDHWGYFAPHLLLVPAAGEMALVTDARFSGVSTGACIGHVGPEALAGGPLGKLRDGDLIRMVIDRTALTGSVDFVGEQGRTFSPGEGAGVLAARPMRADLAPAEHLPADTRLWAALQQEGGGTWGGCVYDVDRILEKLASED